MSGNSCESALQTAPMVSDLAWRGASSAPGGAADGPGSSSGPATTLAGDVGELVFADLQLVAVLEAVRLDPAPVDVGAVERAGVVQEPPVGAVDEDGMVARDGHVVEEDLRIGRAPDRH